MLFFRASQSIFYTHTHTFIWRNILSLECFPLFHHRHWHYRPTLIFIYLSFALYIILVFLITREIFKDEFLRNFRINIFNKNTHKTESSTGFAFNLLTELLEIINYFYFFFCALDGKSMIDIDRRSNFSPSHSVCASDWYSKTFRDMENCC